MAKAATKAKQKWNEAHYSQIKVSVPKNIADMYRAKCANMGVSMASDIITHITGEPVAKTAFPIENRGQRRKSAEKLISTLAAIRDAEEQYMSKIPENLRGGERYSSAEHAVETLDAVIELACDIY